MDAIIKCFSSYGTVEEREACSPSVSQMPQSTRLQNPAEWRSVTHPVKSASLTLPLSQSSSFNSSHIHLLPLSLFIFYFGPLLFLLHLLPCVLDPWVPTNSPPPCNQGWISFLHLSLQLFFFFLAINIRLSLLLSFASTHAAICLFTFWQTWGTAILSHRWAKSMLSWHKNIMWQRWRGTLMESCVISVKLC